ncbi:MAG: serine/threonine-protein kinase [Polyangiaceae bacterium]
MTDDMRERVGSTLAGRYRVTAPLAKGGMGAVFDGVDIDTGEPVAIKLLRKELAESKEALVRFRREIEATERIDAPQIVAVYHADVTDDGTPFMVMERLTGRDLEAVMAGPPLDQALVIALALDLLDGLAHAHAAGVVHRDLKPSNVFMTEGGAIKILDFGIAKVFDDAKVDGGETGKLTSTQAVLGSPAYLSPEQLVSSKEVDGRTDIWSVGVILYELLVGETLFGGDTVGAIFSNVIKMPIAPLASRRPGIDPRLDEIVMRCLEREPSARYQTVVELADDLNDLVGTRPSMLPEATGPAAPRPPSQRAPTVVSDTALTAQWQRKHTSRTGPWLLAAALLVGVVAAAGAMWIFAEREPATAATPAPTAVTPSATTATDAATRVVTSAPDSEPTASPTASGADAPSAVPSVTVRPIARPKPGAPPEPSPEDDLWEGSRH